MIINKNLKSHIKELVKNKYDTKMLQKYFKDRKNTWNNIDVSKVEIYYFDNNFVASRVKLDDSFTLSKIETITDTGIQKILTNHLENHKGKLDTNGKVIAPETLAFSPDGIDELNKNITALNNGKFHQPIFKVRTYEAKGNKFNVGIKGNKKDKFVEAAKGTNLFFAIYYDEENKKRNYETIPLNIVIERQKQGLSSVPEKNEKQHNLVFGLSPNDLVYVPTKEEFEDASLVNFDNLNKVQINRIYKAVSFTGNRLYAVPNNVATSIVDKTEFTQLNKLESSIYKISIKEFCWKLEVNRLGKITKVV
jgi:CRISPR-associated endonuclease Csn1